MSGSNWTAKGGALSDKSSREEYGLTQAEIDRERRMQATSLRHRRRFRGRG